MLVMFSAILQCFYRSPSHTDEEKTILVRTQLQHLEDAQKAREYLLSCISASKAAVDKCSITSLGHHPPLSGPEVAHYSFDFAQQVFR